MAPRIAIPLPHSTDLEYGERAIPQYEHAVQVAGGEPIRVPLDLTANEVQKLIAQCDGILLPGSNADVDPFRFHAPRSPHTAKADQRREAVDDLLIEHAYQKHKPLLGICYGLQSLNVHLGGSLIQHIPDFLPPETRACVNHEAGKKVPVAHSVEIAEGSELGKIVKATSRGTSAAEAVSYVDSQNAALEALRHPNSRDLHSRDLPQSQSRGGFPGSGMDGALVIPVNSSHHQSADAIGQGLRIVARCAEDGIIEAMEGTSAEHFVVAVQWHPERSVDDDDASRAIVQALVQAARR